MFIIYETTCTVNGMRYIGKHYQPDNPHDFDGYLGSGKRLNLAIEKYGMDKFVRKTLFIFETEEEAFAKERELVNSDTIKAGDLYNLKAGGRGGALGLRHMFDTELNEFVCIHESQLDPSKHKRIKDPRRSEAMEGYRTIVDLNTNKLSRIRGEDLPAGFAWYNQVIGNTGQLMCYNAEGRIRYFNADQIPDDFKVGHPKGGLTKGMRYINKNGKRTLIPNESPTPEGWRDGRGRHKSCDYIWIKNESIWKETKVPKSYVMEDSWTVGRLPRKVKILKGNTVRVHKLREGPIPDGWVLLPVSEYIMNKNIEKGLWHFG